MLTYHHFQVLRSCQMLEAPTQRAVVKAAGLPLGAVNTVLKELRSAGLVTEDDVIAERGL